MAEPEISAAVLGAWRDAYNRTWRALFQLGGETAERADVAGLRAAIAQYVQEQHAGPHRYLSTGCYHGRHDYCAAMTGYQGEKRPAQCKWCDARCVCSCHGGDPS